MEKYIETDMKEHTHEVLKDLVKDSRAKRMGPENGRYRRYKMVTEEGSAVMESYSVLDGIELMYQEVHMKEVHHHAKPLPGLFELHYCLEGRVECSFQNGKILYMNEGDVSVGWKGGVDYLHSTAFPSSYFKGIALTVYVPKAQAVFDEFMGDDRKVDLTELCNRFCGGTDFGLIDNEGSHLSSLFKNFYEIPEDLREPFFYVKCLEILLFLTTLTGPKEVEDSIFDQEQVTIVKEVHEDLISHLDKKITIEELARKYRIAPTALKKCFKGVYGESIYQYIKQYRMKEAAKVLLDTNDTVLTIANSFGYENGSKFSDAFRSVMGVKPSEYRKQRKMSNWSGI